MHEVTKPGWAAMTKRGDNRHYNVVDDSDEHLNIEEIKVTPIVMHDANVELEGAFEGAVEGAGDINDDMAEVANRDEEEKQFYRDFLTEKGVDFHHNLGINKLRALYEENL